MVAISENITQLELQKINLKEDNQRMENLLREYEIHLNDNRIILEERDKTIHLVRCEYDERIKNLETNYTNELNQVSYLNLAYFRK